MPYQAGEWKGEEARSAATSPILNMDGPVVPPAKVPQLERLVWMASSFNDPGDDWNEFIGYDAAGQEISRTRFAGY